MPYICRYSPSYLGKDWWPLETFKGRMMCLCPQPEVPKATNWWLTAKHGRVYIFRMKTFAVQQVQHAFLREPSETGCDSWGCGRRVRRVNKAFNTNRHSAASSEEVKKWRISDSHAVHLFTSLIHCTGFSSGFSSGFFTCWFSKLVPMIPSPLWKIPEHDGRAIHLMAFDPTRPDSTPLPSSNHVKHG